MFPLEKSPENKVCSPSQRGDLVPLSLCEDLTWAVLLSTTSSCLLTQGGISSPSWGNPFSCNQVTAGLQEREEAGNFRIEF